MVSCQIYIYLPMGSCVLPNIPEYVQSLKPVRIPDVAPILKVKSFFQDLKT